MPNTEELIEQYIAIRDSRAALAAKFDKEDGELKSKLDALEQTLLEVCKVTGSTGLRTEVGTATRTTKTRYWTSDWEAMHKFIKEHEAFDLLERRIAQNAMKTFLEVNPDTLPQGLNVDSRYAITVRRK